MKEVEVVRCQQVVEAEWVAVTVRGSDIHVDIHPRTKTKGLCAVNDPADRPPVILACVERNCCLRLPRCFGHVVSPS
jgi:hypothetical protein